MPDEEELVGFVSLDLPVRPTYTMRSPAEADQNFRQTELVALRTGGEIPNLPGVVRAKACNCSTVWRHSHSLYFLSSERLSQPKPCCGCQVLSFLDQGVTNTTAPSCLPGMISAHVFGSDFVDSMHSSEADD